MKSAADALCDIGHGVSESQLILNLLSGVNPRFTNTANDIANFLVLLTSSAPRTCSSSRNSGSPMKTGSPPELLS
jgi:hypothetical protein